ncbi:conserved hypothetical protein [Ricinus communis]|uniref:Uncharacterized protein n=1 Tax=Ricinus communis TaxID=3988 RepID=B9T7M1_RICCO|nr:conserved hypothetical protein [Ricinus communis]
MAAWTLHKDFNQFVKDSWKYSTSQEEDSRTVGWHSKSIGYSHLLKSYQVEG